MFKGDSFKKGQTQTVTLESLSENGVNALLKYINCVATEDIESEFSSEICKELQKASEKYSMENLQNSMKCVLLNKPCEWFEVDTTVHLLCFSRNVKNCRELIGKCVQVLKP